MLEPIQEMGLGEKLDSILAISPESLNSLRMASEQLGAQEAYVRALSGFKGLEVSPNLGPQWSEWAAQRRTRGENLSLEDFSKHLAAIGAPSFQFGGFVPGPIGRPQLVVAHGGEEFAGVGMRNNNIDDHRALNVTVNQYGNQPKTADLFLSDSRLRRYFKPRSEW